MQNTSNQARLFSNSTIRDGMLMKSLKRKSAYTESKMPNMTIYQSTGMLKPSKGTETNAIPCNRTQSSSNGALIF